MVNDPHQRRWRLILGGDKADGIGCPLSDDDRAMDAALGALYDAERGGGLGRSSPKVARWLGDIRRYFPASSVQVMQRDALERLNLTAMLLQPELLQAVEPDVHMVATLVSLGSMIPEETKETARQVVRQVVDQLLARLEQPTRQAISGSLDRAQRNRRPRHNEIDWLRTIRANLKHYQPAHHSIVPEQLIGYGRRQRSHQKEVMLCVDQSGSMAASVVYSSIFAAVMAAIPALATRLVVFDTEVVDLSEQLDDPVELLFGTQLGGGTDIARALGYCRQGITRPTQTTLVLITDLYEGGDARLMLRRAGELIAAGVQLIVLLALSDEGAPGYHKEHAGAFAALGAPTFACTPDQFPELMAVALRGGDLDQWLAAQGIVATPASAEPLR